MPETGGTAPNRIGATVLAARSSDRTSSRNSSKGKQGAKSMAPGSASRRLAIEAVMRINEDGAYANLVLAELLAKSELDSKDRGFVTELVYGSTRMRRACHYLADRFVIGSIDAEVRAALQIGAYQLAFLGTPPHAAVAATVGAVRGRGRSMVNAVLRKVAAEAYEYPSRGIELSYPDWLIEEMGGFLGPETTDVALKAMNRAAETSVREDGYIQDPASQMVVDVVAARPGELVVDICAAPGGKATGMASSGATVIACDRRRSRTRLISANADRLGSNLVIVVADGRQPAIRPGTVDKVLVDAPCSGFGSLRRRADARWRIEPEAPQRLADLQLELLRAGLDLLRPGGELIYSVCTLTRAEGPDVVRRVLAGRSDVEAGPLPADPWIIIDSVAVLIPGASDGMMLSRLVKVAG